MTKEIGIGTDSTKINNAIFYDFIPVILQHMKQKETMRMRIMTLIKKYVLVQCFKKKAKNISIIIFKFLLIKWN